MSEAPGRGHQTGRAAGARLKSLPKPRGAHIRTSEKWPSKTCHDLASASWRFLEQHVFFFLGRQDDFGLSTQQCATFSRKFASKATLLSFGMESFRIDGPCVQADPQVLDGTVRVLEGSAAGGAYPKALPVPP